MKRLLFLIGLLGLTAPTLAITPQSMPPPVTSGTTAPAASAAADTSTAPAAANRNSATPARRGSAAPANRGSAAPASTRAYVGPAVVKSWTKTAGANAAPATKSAGTTGADDSSGLRKGTVEGVTPGDSTFRVYGQRLTFDAKRVKIFKGGKPASVYQLRAGANVRFTMDPADPLRKRVAVIYLD